MVVVEAFESGLSLTRQDIEQGAVVHELHHQAEVGWDDAHAVHGHDVGVAKGRQCGHFPHVRLGVSLRQGGAREAFHGDGGAAVQFRPGQNSAHVHAHTRTRTHAHTHTHIRTHATRQPAPPRAWCHTSVATPHVSTSTLADVRLVGVAMRRTTPTSTTTPTYELTIAVPPCAISSQNSTRLKSMTSPVASEPVMCLGRCKAVHSRVGSDMRDAMVQQPTTNNQQQVSMLPVLPVPSASKHHTHHTPAPDESDALIACAEMVVPMLRQNEESI